MLVTGHDELADPLLILQNTALKSYTKTTFLNFSCYLAAMFEGLVW